MVMEERMLGTIDTSRDIWGIRPVWTKTRQTQADMLVHKTENAMNDPL